MTLPYDGIYASVRVGVYTWVENMLEISVSGLWAIYKKLSVSGLWVHKTQS